MSFRLPNWRLRETISDAHPRRLRHGRWTTVGSVSAGPVEQPPATGPAAPRPPAGRLDLRRRPAVSFDAGRRRVRPDSVLPDAPHQSAMGRSRDHQFTECDGATSTAPANAPWTPPRPISPEGKTSVTGRTSHRRVLPLRCSRQVLRCNHSTRGARRSSGNRR